MAAQVSITGIAKTQSFGGRIQRSPRRLPESMARVLAHVFAGAEAEAGLKSISYGQSAGTVSAKGGDGNDLTDGLFAGSEADDGFVHLFAAERYVLTGQRRAKRDLGAMSRAYNNALAAIRLMSSTQSGRTQVAVLFAHYGPVRPDGMDRGDDSRYGLFGEVCTVVEFTPTVLARRESMARKLADERVGAAELEAALSAGRGVAGIEAHDVAAATCESQAREALARSREALAKSVQLHECAVRLSKDVDRRAAIVTVREAAVKRHEEAVETARARRLAFPLACGKHGPERTARTAREVAIASIRAGANREVSTGMALRDLIRNAGPSVQKLSALKVRIKLEGDQVLGEAEGVYRVALRGEAT